MWLSREVYAPRYEDDRLLLKKGKVRSTGWVEDRIVGFLVKPEVT